MKKIRVENQENVFPLRYESEICNRNLPNSIKPFTVLFIKPFQKMKTKGYGPPLGLLTLIAGVRSYFGELVTINFWDMNLYNISPGALSKRISDFEPDVVAVSALNIEAEASYRISEIAKAWNPATITIIGGPLCLRQSSLVLGESTFDWVFEGAADRTLLLALERQFSGVALGTDIPGFSYRRKNEGIHIASGQDLLNDLDFLPLPAWDLVDFDRYAKRDRPRIINNSAGRKYAYLFTSRGCPYLCNYCHDIFTKRFEYRSEQNVLDEIELLYEKYGIREFHIVDDIFNLHKPRVRSLMDKIAQRWPGELYLAFPNGLRGDILDEKTIEAMVRAGTYHATISIETVSPRLQTMVEKYLDIPRAMWAIEEFSRRGVIVQGAFMLGFPGETVEEIKKTVNYAVKSALSHAHFFSVTPQPETPIYEQAMALAPQAAIGVADDERSYSYDGILPWYSRAYNYDLERFISLSYLRFYLYPPRLLRLARIYGPAVFLRGGLIALAHVLQSLVRIPERRKKQGRATKTLVE